MTAAETSCDARPLYRAGEIFAGKYRLEHVLGEGGQACVWQAQNLVLDVPVAIKFVSGADGDGAARLLIEARAAARLRHPGIVRVFDFGRTETGDAFLVLELLEGESLSRLIAREHGLSPTRALALLLPIADALGAAHAAGIVHRDIKPANIFVSTSDGDVQPKLLDFGIAKVESATLHGELTRAGSIVGSPAYLSPEQARGEPDPDHRVDVWAFSATLYQALAGRLPFPETTYNALLWAIVENDPTPLTELGVGDEALWDIVRRGLSKSRVERWGSMQELGVALAAWLVNNGVTEDAAGTLITPRWLAGRVVPDAASPSSESSRPRGVPPSKHLDSTARLHPPLSRSLIASRAPSLRSRAGVLALAAAGGCALAGALFWFQAKGPVASAQGNETPVNALVKDARSPAVSVGSEPVLAANLLVPIVVPAEPHELPPSETPRANEPARANQAAPGQAAAAPSSPSPNPRPSAAPAREKPRTLATTPVLAWATKPVSATKPAPLGADPGAELLNPY